jgi:threonine/homoserine/homoserine lactone efflux protein
MAELFLSILPLAVASAASPIILGVSITLLARKNTGAAIALLLGGIIVAMLLAAAGMSVAAEDDKAAEALGMEPRAADIAIGVLLMAFGIKELLEKPKQEQAPSGAKKSRGFFKWLAISFIGNITNFDAVLLNLAAVRQIFNSTAELGYQLALLAFCDFFFVAPALLPLVFYFLMPEKSERLLSPVGKWMQKYGHYLVGAIFLVFGAYLILKAV